MPKSPVLTGLFGFSMVIEIGRGSIFIDIGILACSDIGDIYIEIEWEYSGNKGAIFMDINWYWDIFFGFNLNKFLCHF